jgi:hypothetical protein
MVTARFWDSVRDHPNSSISGVSETRFELQNSNIPGINSEIRPRLTEFLPFRLWSKFFLNRIPEPWVTGLYSVRKRSGTLVWNTTTEFRAIIHVAPTQVRRWARVLQMDTTTLWRWPLASTALCLGSTDLWVLLWVPKQDWEVQIHILSMPVVFIHCPYSNPHPPQMGRVWVEINYPLKKSDTGGLLPSTTHYCTNCV